MFVLVIIFSTYWSADGIPQYVLVTSTAIDDLNYAQSVIKKTQIHCSQQHSVCLPLTISRSSIEIFIKSLYLLVSSVDATLPGQVLRITKKNNK